MKILYIASLERSGSTILDLVLGCHPNLVSFGEVERVLKPHGGPLASVFERPCTCGEVASRCAFWSIVLRTLEKDDARDLSARYQIFLSTFREVFGDAAVPVDSSKNLRALGSLARVPEADIHVLFSARDVRGWVHSIRQAERRKREMPLGKILTPDIANHWVAYLRHNVLRQLPLWLPWEWMLRNLRIRRFLARNSLKTLTLSYEEIALRTAGALDRIWDYVGITKFDPIGSKSAPRAHIIRGNRTAFAASKGIRIQYDEQWMRSYGLDLMLAFLPPVALMNRKWVYGYLSERGARPSAEVAAQAGEQ